MILLAVIVSTLLWVDLHNAYTWIVLLVSVGFGAVGFGDDYLKLTKRNSKGLPGRLKLILGDRHRRHCRASDRLCHAPAAIDPAGLAVPEGYADQSGLVLPGFRDLRDGRRLERRQPDRRSGRAGDRAGDDRRRLLRLIAYLVGNVIFSGYLQLQHVAGAGELLVFCGALVGASLGFLWFNAPPAMVFMGDTGSLSVGAALGSVAVITKHEIVLAIIGGLFVLETASVIVQVASFKMTGKRVFRMAPLHHHFEKKGWAEPTVVIRFLDHRRHPGAGRPVEPETEMTAQTATLDFSFLQGGPPVAVLGLGKSGMATVEALLASGVDVAAWDDSAAGRETAAARGVPLVDLNTADLGDMRFLVQAPGIPLTFPEPHPVTTRARAAGCEIIGDIELLYRAEPEARYIGITGTNGKSTTTSLIGHILAEAGLPIAVGGNLGTPVLTFPPLGSDGGYVLEMSSYQLDLLDTLVFDAAVLLNITPDHLDRHGGMDGYIAAKERIFAGQAGPQAAIVGIDSDPSRDIAERLAASGHPASDPDFGRRGNGRRRVGRRRLADRRPGRRGDPRNRPRTIQRLPGAHNWQNAAAAWAVARVSGVDKPTIVDGAEELPRPRPSPAAGPHHRQGDLRR
jgi:hypothetical protein